MDTNVGLLRSGDIPAAASRGPARNVGPNERVLSLAAGAALAIEGMRRGGVGGMVRTLAGGALLARGATGHSLVYSQFGATPAERRIAQQTGWRAAAAVSRSVTVARPRAEVFAFWRDFSNLPRVMRHIRAIEVIDDRRSRWTLRAPAGLSVTWEARITDLRDGERIAWESVPGAMLHSTAWVEFRDAPQDRGTEVRALVAYEPPGGQLGRTIAKLFGEEPGQQSRDDLSRFKQMMETGEVATNVMRPAQG